MIRNPSSSVRTLPTLLLRPLLRRASVRLRPTSTSMPLSTTEEPGLSFNSAPEPTSLSRMPSSSPLLIKFSQRKVRLHSSPSPFNHQKLTFLIRIEISPYALGNPTDSTRATLEVTGSDQTCAIFGACDACQNVVVQSIQIDGARDKLGWVGGGLALLEMGGNTKGQVRGHTLHSQMVLY